ncbi:hypothetical protein ACSNOI_35460, partial [Actinomadura kijaniata]|uniref:hypothetical protein n=1 Tax=Actinomadura kijaniata TaxID=46161 RepID=UPI003F1A8553
VTALQAQLAEVRGRAQRAEQLADRAEVARDRQTAVADQLRQALQLPAVVDLDGAPGVRLEPDQKGQVRWEDGQVVLPQLPQRLDPAQAAILARSLLAVTVHTSAPHQK